MVRAVVYVRVSQPDENPDNQKYIIQRYCEEHGLECLFFPPEIGVSRTENPFKRPVFSSLLEFMRNNGINILIVESIDRLTAEPGDWDSLIEYFAEHNIRLIAVKDEDITSAFEGVIRTIESLKKQVSSEVLKVVLDSQIDSLKRQIKMYQKLKVAVAKEYVEDVRYKTRRAMERLKREGRVYHRPRLIHYIALYLKGVRDKRFDLLSREDIEYAREYMRKWLKPYMDMGVPKYRMHREFLRQFSQVFITYKTAPRSYNAFVRMFNELFKAKSK